MEKQELLSKTKDSLSSLETENLISFLQNTTLKGILESPLVLAVLLLVLFYAVIKRSRFMLLFLFSTISLLLLVRYTLPSSEHLLDVKSTLPFAAGCLGIGAVIIYFSFIKSD